MPSKSEAILSSHRDAASRIIEHFRTKHKVVLSSNDALEVVALQYGVANWKTLCAMAKDGRVPRMQDLKTAPVEAGSSFYPHAELNAVERVTPPELEYDGPRPTAVGGPENFIVENGRFGSTEDTGKWCLFRPTDQIDELWRKVRTAIRGGSLLAGMVSTAKRAQFHKGSYVICVFTPDWRDREEVMRVRGLLREIGVTEELGYKRDIETANGVYKGPEEWYYRA
jgi:hypothetical protein